MPSHGLIVQARNALQSPGGMTRALAILLASDPAQELYAQRETQAELPAPPNPTPSTPLTVPTLFGGALEFNAVSYRRYLLRADGPDRGAAERADQPGRQSGDLRGLVQCPDERGAAADAAQRQRPDVQRADPLHRCQRQAHGRPLRCRGQRPARPGLVRPRLQPDHAVPDPGSPTIGDAGFEAPALGLGNWQYGATGSPWSFSGEAGISANNSAFTSGNPLAPEGTQVAFLQQTGSFSQSVYGWDAGSYQLTFDAAQRANFGASNEDFQVLVDGAVVGKFTPAGTAYQTYTTAPFPVAAGSHTITFQGLDTAGGDYTAFIDDVNVTGLNTLTSPLTLDYSVNSPNNDNPYTYQVVGPNNAMVSAATVLDGNWNEAALVVNGNNEQLYLDGLLVGAAQAAAADHYSLSFTDASGNTYAPTGAGFLGGTVDPLAISAAAHPPGIGYPAGFVGALSELRIWSVARTADQIEQAMDAPLALDPTPPGLIGYYDFSSSPHTQKMNGPPLAQISVGAGENVWAVDQTGTVQHWSGTAFQPVKTPATAKMLAVVPKNVQGGSVAYVIDTSNNLYTVGPSGSVVPDTPRDATSGARLPGPSWVGVSNGGTPWMISGGKLYLQDANGFNQGGDWWPAGSLDSPTSVAPSAPTDSSPTGTTNNGDRSRWRPWQSTRRTGCGSASRTVTFPRLSSQPEPFRPERAAPP